jgi:hypothetical protein
MPFFILANPRSGSTMLRLILNAHSKISVPPECGFSTWLGEKYSNINIYNADLYKKYADDVFKTKKFESWGISSDNILNTLNKENPTSYQKMVECVYLAYAIRNKKKSELFGDKNNYYINEIDKLSGLFPDSKYIALIRDGRDVAASYKKLSQKKITSKYSPKLPNDICEIAEEWVSNIKKLNFLRKDKDKIIFIKYEDILRNPERGLSDLFDFLGVEYEPRVLSFYEKNDEPSDFLQWKGMTTKKINKDNAGGYKKNLTTKEIEKFNLIAINQLTEFGY